MFEWRSGVGVDFAFLFWGRVFLDLCLSFVLVGMWTIWFFGFFMFCYFIIIRDYLEVIGGLFFNVISFLFFFVLEGAGLGYIYIELMVVFCFSCLGGEWCLSWLEGFGVFEEVGRVGYIVRRNRVAILVFFGVGF